MTPNLATFPYFSFRFVMEIQSLHIALVVEVIHDTNSELNEISDCKTDLDLYVSVTDNMHTVAYNVHNIGLAGEGNNDDYRL